MLLCSSRFRSPGRFHLDFRSRLISIERSTGSLGLGTGSAGNCITKRNLTKEKRQFRRLLTANFEEYRVSQNPRIFRTDSLHQQLVLPFPWPPPDVVDEPPEFLAEDNEHTASWLEADNRGDSSPHQKGGRRWLEFIYPIFAPLLLNGGDAVCFKSMSQILLALFFFLFPALLFFCQFPGLLFQPRFLGDSCLFLRLTFCPFIPLLLLEKGFRLSTFFGQVGLVALIIGVRNVTKWGHGGRVSGLKVCKRRFL